MVSWSARFSILTLTFIMEMESKKLSISLKDLSRARRKGPLGIIALNSDSVKASALIFVGIFSLIRLLADYLVVGVCLSLSIANIIGFTKCQKDERLDVRSIYYVATEVLHRSYSMEADIWVSRPFSALTGFGTFRSVLRGDPNFDDSPWPLLSVEANDFVNRFLNKGYRKRMTVVQALD